MGQGLFSESKLEAVLEQMQEILDDRLDKGISEFLPLMVFMGSKAKDPDIATDDDDAMVICASAQMLDEDGFRKFVAVSLVESLKNGVFPYVIGTANDSWVLHIESKDKAVIDAEMKKIEQLGGVKNHPLSIDAVVMQVMDLRRNLRTVIVSMDTDGNGNYYPVKSEEAPQHSRTKHSKIVFEVYEQLAKLVMKGKL